MENCAEWHSYQTKGNVLFFIKIWRHIFNLLHFFYYFHQNKVFNITFPQAIITKETVLFLWKICSVHPSLWVAGQVSCLVTRYYKWHIWQTFSKTSLPSHVSLSNKYEVLDMESPSMDDVDYCPSAPEMLPGYTQ